jgi:hypothetical protein
MGVVYFLWEWLSQWDNGADLASGSWSPPAQPLQHPSVGGGASVWGLGQGACHANSGVAFVLGDLCQVISSFISDSRDPRKKLGLGTQVSKACDRRIGIGSSGAL